MKFLGNSSKPVPDRSSPLTGLAQAEMPEPPDWAAGRLDSTPGTAATEPFNRVARLAAMVLGISLASVTVAGRRPGADMLEGRER